MDDQRVTVSYEWLTRPARPPRMPAGALPAAGTASTTVKEPPMSTPAPARSTAGPVPAYTRPPQASAQHLTEVTLDDVLTGLGKSVRRCLATYDECSVLAGNARKLRDALAQLSDDLAEHHNVIGRRTGAAMGRLSEFMDTLARRADAMQTKSLHAAESMETAHDEMRDGYRPLQQATADAGLSMPSARAHNED
ncbi:hypothetical protein AB0G95_34350 [Streptomyces virginiae]|uniref:hypothetical protein n=1 Tax=Streptomyces virginiae TaxID=1961 RepID=UPI003440C148